MMKQLWWNFSREFWSCQVTWHVSTCDVVSHQRTCCEWLTSCVITVLTQWTNICQDLSWFSPCDQVWLSLCVCVYKWLCTLFKKPECCIIYQPEERCCSHLISHASYVLIVSANSCLFRQVRCKCKCSDLHVHSKRWRKRRELFIICKLFFAVITL